LKFSETRECMLCSWHRLSTVLISTLKFSETRECML
jgi:hypothetical protein